MQKDKEKIFYQILLVIAAILLAFMLYRLHEKQTIKQSENPVPQNQVLRVNAKPIVGKNHIISKKYVGYVTPINEVDIIPYINGFVEKIAAQSGKETRAGAPLLRIKPDEYKAKKEAATAAVIKAKATLNNAKIYFERMEKAGEKALSKTEIDNAKAAYLEAKAAYAGAKADLQTALVNLGYTNITAPINGIIGYIDLSVGDYISPAKPLFSIIQFDPIRVVFSISDKDYLEENNRGNLFADNIIKLELPDGKIYDFSGKFAFTDNQINPSTNSLAVYADFKNPNKTLIPNSYVDVIVEKTLKNTISVEKKLLYMQPDGDFLFIIRGGHAVWQKVNIITDDGSFYIINNDFLPGDMLIAEVNNNIKEGMPIEPETIAYSTAEEKK